MPDEEEIQPSEDAKDPEAQPTRRRFLTRRNLLFAATGLGVLALVVVLVSFIAYRTGVFDSYVKGQFAQKMSDIGIVFDADVMRVTLNPIELELKNATFNDRITGEKLFFIRDAHLELSVKDLYAWQLSRDISIDKTEINGAEVWVKFDENGRSNFSNLKLIEDQAGQRVNFRYDSTDLSLRDSVVFFGDTSRRISANARNVLFLLSPENRDVAEEQRRYKFDLGSTDSNFSYDESTVENIDIRAVGIADRNGAEITSFDLRTPIGESTITGTIKDWAAPRYDLDVRSSLDLTQASSILPMGTSIVGVGNFNGKISGQGENYRIEGEADTASLRAAGLSLKGVNVAATVEGTSANYEADGTAIAEMLTFEDFRVDFLKLVGNVRGTGTDFRWVGELQAAAAKSRSATLGGLFLSDALAEVKDKELRAQAGTGRVKRFAIGDKEFTDLTARDLKFSTAGAARNLSAPSAEARFFTTDDFGFQGLTGRDIRIKDTDDGRTAVEARDLLSASANIKDARLKNVSADRFDFLDLPQSTDITVTNLRAAWLEKEGTTISGLETAEMTVKDTPADTVIYSDKLRLAKIDTGSATLGSLNIAGVRLLIKQGRVEARSKDIDAGTVALTKTKDLPNGGRFDDVKVRSPVFVLEPSGRYRATADMTLGGGALGSVALGASRTKVEVTNNRVALNELTADVMDGRIDGQAIIGLDDRTASTLKGDFSGLDLAKLLSLRIGRIIPLDGQTKGKVDLAFTGTNLRNASGTIDADITASAGNADRGLIPISGPVRATAVNGLFNIDQAELRSAKSTVSATGRFDLRDENSDLTLALRSDDANEIDRIMRGLGLAPELEQRLDSMQVQLAGKLTFDGKVTGNLDDPTVDGRAALDSLSLRGREVGSISSDILVSPLKTEFRNGRLQDRTGGTANFTVEIPVGDANDATVNATLTNINAGNLLSALPFDLPERIRDLDGQTTGSVALSGLPDAAQGEINLAAARGIIAGQAFDDLKVKAVFRGTLVELEQTEMRIGAGRFTASGRFDRASEKFDFDLGGTALPVPLLVALVPKSDALPPIVGDVDFTAKAVGTYDRPATYNISFSGVAPNVQVNENSLGRVAFKGQTVGQVLTAELTASLDGNPQVINASVNLGDDNLPLTASTEFNQSPLAPFFSFVPQLKGVPITGTGTGRIEFGGNISEIDSQRKRLFSSTNLAGKAEFSQLALQIQETPLAAVEPVLIRFNPREILFDKAHFAGGGSNMTIAGVKALTDAGLNNLSIDGRVNLNLLNLATKDTFFAGFADTSIRFAGPNATARLSGTATLVNGSVATFLGSDRFTADRLKARLIFTSNQLEVQDATGYLGGGRFTGSGGGTLDGLSVQAFRFDLDGKNVTVPLPKDFTTTGDANLQITGSRADPKANLQLTIGGRVYARRSLYSKDIDLANLVSGRRDPVLSGTSSIAAPKFDLVIEGRDALVVRNNIADLTASVSLVLTGDADNPRLSGRITANSGTILFRKDRYVVQRGVLEFPPDTAIEPVINLQAESEIAGYQVFVNLTGPLKDSELLTASVRSSPALPQADVVSLITTGSLTNAAGGIPTLAQTGINTAAEILTDTIINNPARKATDKLFGLNVFEIDPLISGQQINPGARLTVGRQINNNLRVTYSTNLSQDQNQVLAFEYRVSNRLSFVAQYEQRSLSNVTRERDNFSFEVRLRKRF